MTFLFAIIPTSLYYHLHTEEFIEKAGERYKVCHKSRGISILHWEELPRNG